MAPLEHESVVKDISAFHPGLVVCDAVYHPRETKLLREAAQAGCTCITGEGMLLWQGAAAFRLYTGQDMPVEEVRENFQLITRLQGVKVILMKKVHALCTERRDIPEEEQHE